MSKKKASYYVVWKGAIPGIYQTWDECKSQIMGFPGARYKKFENLAEAEYAYAAGPEVTKSASAKKRSGLIQSDKKPIWESISVDAACSGNPGLMEYRGVYTKNGKQLFHQGPFPEGTNNIGEFLALVHGLALLKKKNSPLPIYSDSKIAIGWIYKKKARTKLNPSPANHELFQLIRRAEAWLASHHFDTPIYKWETASWGEIPADFGRK